MSERNALAISIPCRQLDLDAGRCPRALHGLIAGNHIRCGRLGDASLPGQGAFARSEKLQLGTVLLRRRLGRFCGQLQIEAKALGQSPAGVGRESLEMIANERPDVSHLRKVTFDPEGPAIERCFPLPQQLFVTMQMFPVRTVFGGIIAQQTEIEKIRRPGQELKRRQVALVERSGVGPDPADPVFLEQTDDLRPVPSRVPEFDGESERFWQLFEKGAQSGFAFFRGERGRELDQDNLEFGCDRFDGLPKLIELGATIAQPAGVSDGPGKFAGETKMGRGHIHPAPGEVGGWSMIKCGIDLDRRKMAAVELEPVRLGQAGRVKCAAPFLKSPGAGADANFLLIRQVQGMAETMEYWSSGWME